VLTLIKIILLLLIVVAAAFFASLNPGEVTLHYYFGSIQLSLAILLVATLGVGLLLGLFVGLGLFLRAKRDQVRLQRKARLAEQEVNNLRAIPLKDH